MKTPTATPMTPTRLASRLEFEALTGLPCGCVAASFRAMPWGMEFVRLEAKGPHCFRAEHSSGSVLSLESDPDDEFEAPCLQ
jgi:hypothetical protein